MSREIDLPGYRLDKLLQRSRWGEVYLGARDLDEREVVLKIFERTDGAGLAQREREALEACVHPAVPEVLDLVLSQEHAVLVLERVPGVKIEAWLQSGLPSIEAFLEMARQVAEALTRVHAARILHRDVTPRNVLVHPKTLETHLIDFGLARPFGTAGRRGAAPTAGSGLEGTLLYIAPEQTGRMNRACDFRTDLYTLGATLYLALTGRPPFESTDPLWLIHAHIARAPASPREIRPEVPEVVAQLVLKLLRKEPDERYQTAAGLHADLRALCDMVSQPAALASFELGSQERLERPRFARTLVGRERELARLTEALRAVRSGEPRFVVVEGPAGVGKSSLVDGLRPQVAELGGYLAEGRFDRARQRPYAGFGNAVDALAQQILVGSDEHLAAWRSRLLEGVGRVAGALLDLSPEVGFILGEAPPLPALGPVETQARLMLALERFLGVCATPEQPLVLFLDDLQWCDSDSRALLEHVLASCSRGALLLICAGRSDEGSDEGDESLAFSQLLSRIEQRGIELTRIAVGPLSDRAALDLLCHVLEREPVEVRPLAEQIAVKTSNRPLLIEQLIEQIHSEGLLHHSEGRWCWDVEAVRAVQIPDDAVGFMTTKIDRLDATQRSVLQLASVLRDVFQAAELVGLGGLEREAVESALYALSEAGLIVPCSGGFQFAHERIRSTARELLPPEERARFSLQAGRRLLDEHPEAAGPEVFQIADYLNQSASLLDEDLRRRMLELDVEAGRRALSKGAAAQALTYLEPAADHFGDADWVDRRAQGFALFSLLADSSFQTGDLTRTSAVLDLLETRSPDMLQRAQIDARRIRVLALRASPEDGAQYALVALRRLGLRWPLHPSTLRARLALRWVGLRLGLRGRKGPLFYPARSVPPKILAALTISHASGPVRARVDGNLVALSLCFGMRQLLRYGYQATPGYLLSAYAMYAQCVLRDLDTCRRYASLAMEWIRKVPSPSAVRGEYQIHISTQPWWMPRRRALAPMADVIERLREAGDQEYVYYAAFLSHFQRALAGDPVEPTELRMREVSEMVQRGGHWYLEPSHCHAVYSLLTLPELEEGQLLSRIDACDRMISESDSSGIFSRTLAMLVLCVHGEFEAALVQSERVWPVLFRASVGVQTADHLFYRGLISAALAHRSKGSARRRHRRALARCKSRIERWVKGSPDFVAMLMLLEAECVRLSRKSARADGLYQRAARRAREQEFVHLAALAQERRAGLLGEQRRYTAAAQALNEALTLYAEWGVPAKLLDLERQRTSMRAL